MLDFVNLLVPVESDALYTLYMTLSVTMIALMCLSAIAAIVLVLLQPGNSTGIDALGGSSETFFGKNKGKSIEAKMKKWTIVCLVVLVIFSIPFFILHLGPLWTYLTEPPGAFPRKSRLFFVRAEAGSPFSGFFTLFRNFSSPFYFLRAASFSGWRNARPAMPRPTRGLMPAVSVPAAVTVCPADGFPARRTANR